GVGREERVLADFVPIPARTVDLGLAHLHQRPANEHAADHLAGDRAGYDARGRLARRRAPAAAIVANAVLRLVGVIGVARAVLVLDVAIVLRSLIDIVDEDADRRSGRDLTAGLFIDHNAGENASLVRLAPLRGEARSSWPPPVEVGLNVGGFQGNARRAAVDDASDPRPVAFAEGREAEQMSEGVVGNGERYGSYGTAMRCVKPHRMSGRTPVCRRAMAAPNSRHATFIPNSSERAHALAPPKRPRVERHDMENGKC